MKTYKKHRGVNIYRVKFLVHGSDWGLDSNDEVVYKKGKFDTYFVYGNSSTYDTVKECSDNIEDIYFKSDVDFRDTKEFAEIIEFLYNLPDDFCVPQIVMSVKNDD